MLEFPGYLLKEEIYTSTKTLVFKAQRKIDKKPVILKTVQSEYPSINEISQLRYEYQISHSIDYPGIVKTYSFEIYKNNVGIIKEDFSAITLKDFFRSHKTLTSDFLEIAIQLSDILAHLHQLNIIHKDINPSNILICAETKQVKLTDFSIASRLQTESYQQSNYVLLEGTPAYISPEQTGRMNRVLDYRTDLYSLGVTFYELLVGHLPFPTPDLLELIHSHISQYPLFPEMADAKIPMAISDIAMKLMAKNAEDRYQSALGLKADLEYCLQQIITRDYIPPFELGRLDYNSQFLIPQKLYGRDIEVSKLLSSFERVRSGELELALISGYSGIGKTSIVNEVQKSILHSRGFFIQGKFEQLQRNIPYLGFIQGFREFINHLLSESPEKLEIWRNKLLHSVGKNGQIIIDNIPELELIIGKQPTVPALGSSEEQNRFNQVFQSFIRVFSQPEHPLVIFLDDLQWADLASLKLIERVIKNSDNRYLLIVGAYRDNEVNSRHSLVQILDDLNSEGIIINSIILEPLGWNAVQELVNETLCTKDEKTDALTELIYNKSAGNPFFLSQLLYTLYNEELIYFNYSLGIWEWNIEEIYRVKIIDYSIIDLIIQNLKKLPSETQELLKVAACIGNKFSLRDLSTILIDNDHNIASKLWLALQKGLILPLSGSYKLPLVAQENEQNMIFSEEISYQFLHDRVQQASYALIDSDKKNITHLRIGELLLETTSDKKIEVKIFDIVNQMNLGISLIHEKEKRNKLASLNMIAGKRAKESAAYQVAKKYFDLCLELLPRSSWEINYEFTINAYLLSLEIAYINTEFNRANALLESILSNSRTRKDIIRAYEFQIPYYFTQNQPVKAIDTALNILRKMDVVIPRNPKNIDILISIFRVKIAHRYKKITDLARLPLLRQTDQIAAMRILMAVIPATFVASPELFPIAISRMVEISLKYGNSPYSIFAYNSFGTLQCGALGNFKAGYKYSLLALDLLNELQAPEFKSKVYMVFNAFNRPWTDHLYESVKMLPEGVSSGLETGDIEYVGHCASFFCIYIFLIGENIESVIQKQSKYLHIISECKQEFQSYHARIWQQVAFNLLGRSHNPIILSGDSFSEDFFYKEVVSYKNDLVNLAFYCAKSLLAVIFNDFDEVLHCSSMLQRHSRGVPGIIYAALNNFFLSLALLKCIEKCSGFSKIKLIFRVNNQQKQMKKWVDSCPDNFLHKYQLIEAEKSKALSKYQRAMKYYDLAIGSASKAGYIQEEAIANECAAEFYFDIGRVKVAQVYLTDAYYGYAKWGALAKVSQLQEKYPDIFSRLQKSAQVACSLETTESSATTTGLIDLDLASVLKVSQAISEEIILDQLLEKLMQVLMQSAGAQSIVLILMRDQKFVIEASTTENLKSIRQSIQVFGSKLVPCSVINYVARTLEPVFLGDAATSSNFSNDTYIESHKTKSLLCLPMINQGHLIGMVYLENNLAYDAFRVDHLEVLNLLCAQAAISLENACLYEDLQKSKAREQAEREINELKSRFISMTSHEFRTPLTAILGTTELIKHYGQGWETEKQHSYLDRIQRNVKHMTGLLDDVLVLSKADVGKTEFNPVSIDLTVFCSSLVEEFQLNTKRGQNIEYVLEGKQTTCFSDEKILRQILSNLLSNAIKYSPESSIVCFTVTFSNDEVIFLIKDQGIGIPESDQPHLFESFQRATNVGQIQGTGLGLAIVKKSVELHQGTITFESIAGQGTTFMVRLPITAESLGIESH